VAFGKHGKAESIRAAIRKKTTKGRSQRGIRVWSDIVGHTGAILLETQGKEGIVPKRGARKDLLLECQGGRVCGTHRLGKKWGGPKNTKGVSRQRGGQKAGGKKQEKKTKKVRWGGKGGEKKQEGSGNSGKPRKGKWGSGLKRVVKKISSDCSGRV